MRAQILAAGAALAIASSALPAAAATARFSLNGGPFSATGVFSIVPDVPPPDPDVLCGALGNNPCRTDPSGAYAITGVTGTFSDSNLGISNAQITGLVPIHPAPPRDPVFDPQVPVSLSFIDYGPPAGSLTYNNLFFPGGSPIDCDYPFTGTFADVFGAALTIAGGDTVDIWGDGNEPGVGLTYGVAVTDGRSPLDYQFDGVSGAASVPEPAAWALLMAGFAGAGLLLRNRRQRVSMATVWQAPIAESARPTRGGGFAEVRSDLDDAGNDRRQSIRSNPTLGDPCARALSTAFRSVTVASPRAFRGRAVQNA